MFKLYKPDMILTMPDGEQYNYEELKSKPKYFPLTMLDKKWVVEGIDQGYQFITMDFEELDKLLLMYDVDGDLAASGLSDEEIVAMLNTHLDRDPITKYDLTMSILNLHKELEELKEYIHDCIGAVCMVHADMESQR